MIEQIKQHYTALKTDGDPEWLKAFRSKAMESAELSGLPTKKDELWRFTSLNRLDAFSFDGSGGRAQAQLPAGLNGYSIVFMNGQFSSELSKLKGIPEGVDISPISKRLPLLENYVGKLASTQSPFVAANSALFSDGAYIQVADGIELEKPVNVIYLTDQIAGSIQLRSSIVCGKNAKATVIEHFVGAEETVYWTNAVTELYLGEQAHLDHIKIQQESTAAFHFQTVESELQAGSVLNSHAITQGGNLARNDIRSKLIGEEAESICNGLYLLKENQECDTHLFMDHAVPNCNSHELYKGILDDKAHAVFCGRILVAKDAQKTDAKQSNANLLLSRGAKVNSLPQLEIYADDVKCTHGATIGQLEDEALYYLQTRGISREQGHVMLTYAFANEVLESIRSDEVKAYIGDLVQKWLKEVAV